MVFTWHPVKSERNLREGGFDFAFATSIFQGPTLEKEERRRDYGERRMVAMGKAEGLHLTVVYTDREGPGREIVRRIISARGSNRRERQAYRERIES